MFTETFYSELPIIDSFLEITEPNNFFPVPHDWYILITDIVGSTKAIEAGRYRDVNLIGACSIIAVLNQAKNLEFPFVFGGDGASMVIPSSLFSEARQALLGTRNFAKTEFNLDLRVGIVPVSAVIEARHEVKVAKLKVSDTYNQGIFAGGGLTYATQLVKDPSTSDIYTIQNSEGSENADFSGLKCLWQDILSQPGEAISLLVLATASTPQEENRIYKSVLEEINKIYGNIESLYPVIPETLKVNLKNKSLHSIVKVYAKSNNYLNRLLIFVEMKLQRLFFAFLSRFKIKLPGLDIEYMKKLSVKNSDFRKFDDLLRIILSGNAVQRQKLLNFLDEKYQANKLVYGIHVSNRILMTCLFPVGTGRDVHLLDGADGGYTLAAKDLKARINLSAN